MKSTNKKNVLGNTRTNIASALRQTHKDKGEAHGLNTRGVGDETQVETIWVQHTIAVEGKQEELTGKLKNEYKYTREIKAGPNQNHKKGLEIVEAG